MKHLSAGLVVVVALSCVGGAMAQETTGAIVGIITGHDGLALPGVTVEVSDTETGLRRSAVSDSRGEYRIAALPPANYGLTASLEGFQAHQRGVRVELGRTLTAHVTLAPAAFAGEVEVTGEQPLVDLTSTVTGINVSVDELHRRLPIAREATEVAFLAPSTVAGDGAFEDGTAGFGVTSFTPGQRPVSIGGASVSENAYQVNGLNVTNFRTMIGSTMVPYEFLEEVQIKTGGYQAEFGRATGGVINMVTKTGTNSFHGNTSLYWEPESLQEQQPDTYASANQMEQRESTEINASLGGPILRDRLFFFGFVRYTDSSMSHFYRGRGERWSLNEPYCGGKVDFNVNSSHRIEGTYINDDVSREKTALAFDFDSRTVGDQIGVGFEDRGGASSIIKYTGILGEDVLVSAQYGSNDFNRTNHSTGDDCPLAYDYRGGVPIPIGCWVNRSRGSALDERRAYRVDTDLSLGNHSFRAGIDSEDNTSRDELQYSGGVLYRYFVNIDEDGDGVGDVLPDYPAGGQYVDVRHYSFGGSFPVESRAAYIQDGWAVTSNVTLNLGLRYEDYLNKNGLGQSFINVDNQWAPRLGVIWDPSHRGRDKVFLSLGRYYVPVASNVGMGMGGAESYDVTQYAFSGDPDPNDGSPPGFVDCGFGETCPDQGSVGEVLDYSEIADGFVPDPREVISANLDPMSQDEVMIGYERLVGDEWSVGVKGLWREFNAIIEDYSINQAITAQFGPDYGIGGAEWRVGNPGSGYEGLVNIDGVLTPVSFTAEELGYPEPVRKYGAIEFTFERRFADHWMCQGSYTWSHLYGNYEGGVYSDKGQSDTGLTELFDFPGLAENTYGNLPQDRRHNIKLFGTYVWDNGVSLGGNFWFHTGRPINAISVYPDRSNPAYRYASASHFLADGTAAPRGSQGTTDSLWSLDLMARYEIPLGGVDLFARVDIFNLFDNAGVREVDEFAEYDNGAANPNWKAPTLYQSPRSVRIGVGISF